MYHVEQSVQYLKWWLIGLAFVFAWPALAQETDEPPLRPATVIYKLNANATPSEMKGLNALLNSHGLVSERTLDGSQIIIATFDHPGREKAIANILDKSGYVEFAEPDYAMEPTAEPNDTFFAQQWHHTNVNSRQAWDMTTGTSSVLVAVCDTGFDASHPDLGPNLRMDLAFNAQDGSTYTDDANGHGTGSAGTLGAVGNNGIGVAGANWQVDIIPVRIAISDQNSSAYISTMATCIEYATDNNARVVNLSYGGIQYSTIDAAAQYLRANNGLLFMSAGNSGQEHSTYPDFTSFVGVGATDRDDTRASFSSWGTYVDITAPGVDIATTYPDDQYVYYSGTSFSSPLTAGIAALMVAANPAITPAEIENGLFSTAVDIGAAGDDNVFGHGLVDAFAAVSFALQLGDFEPPVANLSVANNPAQYDEVVGFSSDGSMDPDGSSITYYWDFGDGSSSTAANPTHTYYQAGSFQVSLTVTDVDNLSDTAVTTVQITNQIPNPVISIVDAQSSYDVEQVIKFVGSGSTDGDGSIVSHAWEFGNGDTSSVDDPLYAYPAAGSYTVTLTVTDNAGAPNSTSVVVNVIDPYELTAPSDLAATVNGADVSLTWQDNTANESNYLVERGTKRRGRVTFNTEFILGKDATGYVDTVPDTGNYYYRVSAYNANNQATSATIQVSVDSVTSPDPEPDPGGVAAPSDLSLSRSGDTVTLNWNDNAEADSFVIERGLKQKGQFNFDVIASDHTSTTFADTAFGNLPNGNYGYRVKAIKGGEASSYSNIAEIRKK